MDHSPDYDAEDVLVVSEPRQLKAIANALRAKMIMLLRERALSTQQLAAQLGLPKGTVAHHVKVLERAGLIHVVRTRKVRAVTEKYYGRVAHLFLLQTEGRAEARALGATVLSQASSEVERAPECLNFGHVKARLAPKDMLRLERRLKRLLDDFRAAESPGGTPCALVGALYERPDA